MSPHGFRSHSSVFRLLVFFFFFFCGFYYETQTWLLLWETKRLFLSIVIVVSSFDSCQPLLISLHKLLRSLCLHALSLLSDKAAQPIYLWGTINGCSRLPLFPCHNLEARGAGPMFQIAFPLWILLFFSLVSFRSFLLFFDNDPCCFFFFCKLLYSVSHAVLVMKNQKKKKKTEKKREEGRKQENESHRACSKKKKKKKKKWKEEKQGNTLLFSVSWFFSQKNFSTHLSLPVISPQKKKKNQGNLCPFKVKANHRKKFIGCLPW